MIALTDIPFSFNTDQLKTYLKIEPNTEREEEFDEIIEKTIAGGKPKALYRVSYIDEKGDDTVSLEGVTFQSLALRKHLDEVERVFPYIVTCGTEIDDLGMDEGDFEKKYWINMLKEQMLESGMQFLRVHISEKYRLPGISSMNPGSGDASVWPLEQQKYLFSILGNVEELIGVRLTKTSMLAPEMSLSGICFPSEVDFMSCQLCMREKCRSRQAAFDQELWNRMNQQKDEE